MKTIFFMLALYFNTEATLYFESNTVTNPDLSYYFDNWSGLELHFFNNSLYYTPQTAIVLNNNIYEL